jgi:hypothetical protein
MRPEATFHLMDDEPQALAESLWPNAYAGAETYAAARITGVPGAAAREHTATGRGGGAGDLIKGPGPFMKGPDPL